MTYTELTTLHTMQVTKVHSMLDRLEAPQLHSRQDAVDVYMRQSGLYRHCDNIAHQSMA